MFGDQNTSAMNQRIEGLTVYDTAGEQIGTVSEQDAQGGYFVMQKGWLFPRDLYVPYDAIDHIDTDGVYLTVAKDAISSQQWDNPPVGGMSSATLASDTTVDTSAGSTVTQTTRAARTDTATDEVRVPVREEELVAGTRPTEEGRVRLRKDVVEEQQTLTVPVTREQVRVERVPVSGDAPVDDDAFEERDIEVPVMGEEVVAGKRARVVEEVRLHKDVVTDQEQVSDTVRKERVQIDGADVDDSVTSTRRTQH
jgi:uncharacterized protein (TIGR02271 family)